MAEYDILKRKHIKKCATITKPLYEANTLDDKNVKRQTSIASKVLFSMISSGVVREDKASMVLPYLEQIYSVGYNDGHVIYSHSKRVSSYDDFGNKVETYNSAAEAARKLGVCKSGISKAAKGRTTKSCGYFWRYE